MRFLIIALLPLIFTSCWDDSGIEEIATIGDYVVIRNLDGSPDSYDLAHEHSPGSYTIIVSDCAEVTYNSTSIWVKENWLKDAYLYHRVDYEGESYSKNKLEQETYQTQLNNCEDCVSITLNMIKKR